MTAGCYYDNASFVNEEEHALHQKTQPKPQSKPQLQPEEGGTAWVSSSGCGDKKPTLLTLSRSASVRYRPGGCVGSRNEAIGDFLARQIDQQRQSEPPLSRNPSVRYSRRFPPVACGSARSTGYSNDSDEGAAAAAAAAAAVAVAKATRMAASAPTTRMLTSVQVHTFELHKEESQPIVLPCSSGRDDQ